MRHDELPQWSTRATQWAAEYHKGLRDRPVRAQVSPGAIAAQIGDSPPELPEDFETIFEDFKKIIPEGMTHWQHPRFFAYFPSNAAPVSMLAEQLANAFSAQCMLWQTSPAATELETVMIDWLRQALGLPEGFRGLIQDTASTTTLCALLTMRERALQWKGNSQGLSQSPRLRIYASAHVHSSIDKAVRLSGIGHDNLVKIETDDQWAMCPEELQKSIDADRAAGYLPAGVVGCIGGTSIGASDRITEILKIAKAEDLYSHVDAAWAGTAMICPEFRNIWEGVELADSVVFNPHKWMGVNFDCSVQFLRDPADQVRTLSIRPDYLETLEEDQITNYSEWTIPLGRRFRALKLWFLMRAHGLENIRTHIRNHVQWTVDAAEAIAALEGFEIVTPPMFSLFTFRFAPEQMDADSATQELLERINADGRTYLTQTKHDGKFVIRMSIGQFETTKQDVDFAIDVIRELSQAMI